MKEVEGKTKEAISEAVDPLKNEIADVKGDLVGIKERLSKFEQNPPGDSASFNRDVYARLAGLEKQFGSASATVSQMNARPATVLFGGFETDFDDACAYINSELDKINAQRPTQFFKGDSFRGLVFCKFDNGRAAENIITAFNARPLKHKSSPISCKPDLPIDKRVSLSLLLGLRRQLISWGFDRRAVKVDDHTFVMSFSGKDVATTSVKENMVVIEWLDPTWGMWEDLQASPEFTKLIGDNNKRLALAAESVKGGGKGKSKE